MCASPRRPIVKRTPKPRSTQPQLSPFLHQKLNSYAIAAGAASVSLLALASPAGAEVVYTPANQTIDRSASYSLDLNHDGIVDFVLLDHKSSPRAFSTQQILMARAAPLNQVNCPSTFCISSFVNADALDPGTVISPSEGKHGWLGGRVQMALEFFSQGFTFYTYAWVHAQDKYLGLRFTINGEMHYGWARLTVHFHGGPAKGRTWDAHLTGYAYETVPDKGIRAGQTEGAQGDDAEASLPKSATGQLSALALGSHGIALWRRGD
jgi:hypothetical protein